MRWTLLSRGLARRPHGFGSKKRVIKSKLQTAAEFTVKIWEKKCISGT